MILASSRGAMPLLPLLSALIVVAATVWLLVALSGKILDRDPARCSTSRAVC